MGEILIIEQLGNAVAQRAVFLGNNRCCAGNGDGSIVNIENLKGNLLHPNATIEIVGFNDQLVRADLR